MVERLVEVGGEVGREVGGEVPKGRSTRNCP
jgi:hypothetical protein